MDDTGFFSVQVINKALQVWGLEIFAFGSSETQAVNARLFPTDQNAYICNYQEHWFTVRKIANQWFNLNSLLTSPELISSTYLSEFLAQLQQEGYSIYVVTGTLPTCVAEDILRATPAVQTTPPRLLEDSNNSRRGRDDEFERTLRESRNDENDDELQLALQMSRAMSSQGAQNQSQLSEEEQIKQAIQMSLSKADSDQDLQNAIAMSMEQKALPKSQTTASPSKPSSNIATSSDTDGLRLGGQTLNRQSTPDPDEIRRRRLAFLEKQNAPK